MEANSKFIIGLTGNIGCGKSLVRSMLEYLGAHGIDADALSREVIDPGTKAYKQVLKEFGDVTQAPGGPIDRKSLGKIVFGDPERMKILESIVHPAVIVESENIIRKSNRDVIVLEAIKLMETSLAKKCDSVWLVTAPKELQLQRLMETRGMSEEDALQRIEAQTPQEEKAQLADVIIVNAGSMDETWMQVVDHWIKVVPAKFRNAELSDAALERQLSPREYRD